MKYDKIAIRKRPDKGLLAGMYEFPMLEGHLKEREVIRSLKEKGLETVRIEKLPDAAHIFSHKEWHMKAYEIRIAEGAELKDGCILVSRAEIADKALPSAFRAYTRWYALREDE